MCLQPQQPLSLSQSVCSTLYAKQTTTSLRRGKEKREGTSPKALLLANGYCCWAIAAALSVFALAFTRESDDVCMCSRGRGYHLS